MMGMGTNILTRMLFDITKVRSGTGSSPAQPPRKLPAYLGRGADTAEELGIVAGDCGAVCQRLGELRGFREVSLGKTLVLINSS